MAAAGAGYGPNSAGSLNARAQPARARDVSNEGYFKQNRTRAMRTGMRQRAERLFTTAAAPRSAFQCRPPHATLLPRRLKSCRGETGSRRGAKSERTTSPRHCPYASTQPATSRKQMKSRCPRFARAAVYGNRPRYRTR